MILHQYIYMKKIIKTILVSVVSFAILITNCLTNLSAVYAKEELVNVALNDGVQVYTNPSVKNGNVIVDGDTKYQYVTQGARNFIDLSFQNESLNSTMKQDENGYNYNTDAYVIVDLGKAHLLNSLKVYDFEREGGFQRDYIYDVFVSNDPDFDIGFEYNVNWQKVGAKAANTEKYVMEFTFDSSIAARYIKIGNLKCKNANGFVMTELEAWAKEDNDITTLKKEAIQQLQDYKNNIKLNEEETQRKELILNEYTNKINDIATTTKEQIYEFLGQGQNELANLYDFAEYRENKKAEIQNYKAEEGLFSEEDKDKQLAYLAQAVTAIEQAKNNAEVDEIISQYMKKVDALTVLDKYEIIPSPHSISYTISYTNYSSLINVVASKDALDIETINYIKEIFGENQVSFATSADGQKTNLFLARNNLDDAIKSSIVTDYPQNIDQEILKRNESHIIIADEKGISILGNDADGLFRGLTTIKFIKSQIESQMKYRHFVIKDYADMPFRGLIEGYYGKPWSWEEKAELLKFGSDFKMNKLVFAPKNDPYHTTKWKELYPDKSVDPDNNIQNIEIAASTARKYKADLVWTAHCFGYTDLANAGENGIRYQKGDENIEGSDINLLKAKFEQMYDAGVRTFGLLLDDCDYGPRTLNSPYPNIYNPNEPLDEAVLEETTAIVNIMADWCKEKGDCYDLIFCPAGYVTSWMRDGFTRYFKQAYPYQEISYYDIHFRDNVQIITTGTGVFSDTNQQVSDLFKTAGVGAQTGYSEGETRRSPLMWTNYPTVDNASALDFGPIENFKTDLKPEDLSGMMSNPFQWAEFNKTVIPMVTQYTWNLKDYKATDVYNQSMKYVMDGNEELAQAMLIFTNHNSTRGSEGEGSEELKKAINAFKQNISKENAEAVLVEINKIIEACDTLMDESRFVDKGMYEQLNPYAKSLKDLAGSIQKYMESFEDNVDYKTNFNESGTLFTKHTSYVLKDIPQSNGTKKDMYTASGTRTLKPFYNWLKENESNMIQAILGETLEEMETKKEWISYINEQISKISNDNYYYGYDEKLTKELESKISEIESTVFAQLPSFEDLKVEVENIIASYEQYKPKIVPNNLISNRPENVLTASSKEEVSGNTMESIIDGNINTTFSTVMGASNPAYLQFDFKEEIALENIHVTCYTDPNGKYRWYKYEVYTSTDGVSFKLLTNKSSQKLEKGKGDWFDARGVSARYVRVVGNANSVNKYFHVAEVEVYQSSADIASLIEAINATATEAAKTNVYTAVSIAALQAVIDAANLLKDDENATVALVAAQITALEDAVRALVKLADKSALQAKIDAAKAVDTTNKTPNSVKALQAAITAAEAVINDAQALQADADAQVTALTNAMDGLVDKANTATLDAAIIAAEAEAAKTDTYTEASINAVQSLITAAKALKADENATQVAVDAEVIKLNDAVAAMDKAGVVVDKTPLTDLIANAKVEVAKTDVYTAESLELLQAAITAAEAVNEKEDATVDDVKAAIKAMNAAVNGLVKVEKPNPDDEWFKATDDETGVYVTAPAGVVDPNAVLVVKPINAANANENVAAALKKLGGKQLAYDISLLLNGVAIQPNGTLYISINIPKEYFGYKNFQMYHISEDGTVEKVLFTGAGTVENGGSINLQVDYLSIFVLVAEHNEVIKPNQPIDKNPLAPSKPVKDTATDVKTPNTSDNTMAMTYVMILVCAGAFLVFSYKRKDIEA